MARGVVWRHKRDLLSAEGEATRIIHESLVHGWCVHGNVGEVRRAMEAMRSLGIRASIASYNDLLLCVCNRNAKFNPSALVPEATNLMTDMKTSGVPPTTISFNILLSRLARVRRVKEAYRILYLMRQGEAGCSPDWASYHIVIRLLYLTGRFVRGNRLLDEMPETGLLPGASFYHGLVGVLCGLEKVDHALQMLDRMKRYCGQCAGPTYDLLIAKLSKNGKFEQATNLWNEARERGIILQCSSDLLDPSKTEVFKLVAPENKLSSENYKKASQKQKKVSLGTREILNSSRATQVNGAMVLKKMELNNKRLASHSSVSDPKSSLREILAMSKLEPVCLIPSRSSHSSVCQDGALKEKKVVSCRMWSEEGLHLARLETCYALAKEGRLKQIRRILRQMVDDGGVGSAPLFCEQLSSNFRDWNYNNIVWDMLANVYARLEWIHDALFVINKMTSLDMQASISTYDCLLSSVRHMNMVCNLYEEIKSSGISCREYTFDILIDGLCKQGRLQDAISFFQETREKIFNPCIITFNSLMSGACKAHNVEIAWSLLSLSLKYGFLPDTYSYAALIHGLCLEGRMEEALELSQRMENDGIELDVVIYNILINGWRLHGFTSEIWKLLRKIIQQGMQPDLVTYSTMITALCEKGEVNEALKMSKDMVSQGCKLNIVTYSVLLNALLKKGRITVVEQLLDEIKEIGLDMDVVAYSILINGYCKAGEIEKAIQVCQTILSNRVVPNSFTHGGILSSLCKKGLVLVAKWYLENLAALGHTVDIILYNIVIDGFAKIGDVDGALELYEQLSRLHVIPTAVTYNSLIYGFCKIGKLSTAKSFLRKFDLHGLVPTVITYTMLIDAYCEAGDANSMLELLDEMVGKTIRPNKITYSVIMKALCKKGRVQEAINILKDMHTEGIGADEVTYNTLIQGFYELRNLKMVFLLHDEMLEHSLMPTPITYNFLIDSLCLNGEVDKAERLLYFLLERDVRLRKFAYTTVIKAYCAKAMPDNAIVLFDKMLKSGYEVSIKDFCAMINRLCKRRLVNEAKIFFNMMLYAGIFPDQELCSVMYNAFHKINDYKSLVTFQAIFVKGGLIPLNTDGRT